MATNSQANNIPASNTPASNLQAINKPAISLHFINPQTNSSQASSSQASTSHAPAFERVLKEFKNELRAGEMESYKIATLAGLEKAIGELRPKQNSSRSRINLNRLKPLLEALDQYSKVVTLFCNSSEFIPFIWVSKIQLQLKTKT
jgi:hypothetical protein